MFQILANNKKEIEIENEWEIYISECIGNL